MNKPKIQLMAVSNVFTRLMHFEKAGDGEVGHYHNYDHGTLVSSGKVLVEMLDHENNCISSKEFTAPAMIFIPKDKKHRLTALEDNTVAACIHALRDVDSNLLSPDFFVDETQLKNYWREDLKQNRDVDVESVILQRKIPS